MSFRRLGGLAKPDAKFGELRRSKPRSTTWQFMGKSAL